MNGTDKHNAIKSMITKFGRDTRGGLAITFAVLLPVIVGSVGMSVDLARSYLVKERLGGALDAAALAAAASESDPAAIEQRVQEFFDANYPESKIGTAYDLQVTVDDVDVYVSASADYQTTFMRILGVNEVTIFEQTIVRREMKGLEVALVLDNTGSMSSNNNIQALRTAAANFVDIMFSGVDDPEDVRIGLVPYSSSVNVGSYGIGENPDGSLYGTGDVFVELPAGWSYDANSKNARLSQKKWLGCVLAYNALGWDPDNTDNDPYPDDVRDAHSGPWEPYFYETYGCSGKKKKKVCQYTTYNYPNYNCPQTSLVPLTSDQDKLITAINTMEPKGYTLGNYGMIWGYRVLSPELPFAEGSDWDSRKWQKAVIMMTDGVNTMESNYTAYWRTRNHNISVTDLNDRFEEVCTALKEQDVLIYTVTFTSGVNEDTKDYYRRCATTEGQYYDAPSQDDLITVFESISRELASLHIRQ